MRKLRFVCAQPATLYYAWQVEVMLNNFIELGINPNNVDIVCWKQNNVIPDYWSKMADSYPARFFFYDQTRETTHYISSIRPNLLKQHWLAHPELQNDAIFYHDSDIIFTKPISEWISSEILNDNVWYGSDTRWYISHAYIKGRGQEVLDKMCEIMQMDQKVIEDNELNCIGAQYLMKDVTWQYWDRVEKDCEILFKDITELNEELVIQHGHTMPKMEIDVPMPAPYNPLQIWCADMWAVLWGAWRLGIETKCIKEFDFSWATSGEEQYHKMNIMHNAGATCSCGGLFYKAEYMNELPYGKELKIKEGTASLKYWEAIQKAGLKTVLKQSI